MMIAHERWVCFGAGSLLSLVASANALPEKSRLNMKMAELSGK